MIGKKQKKISEWSDPLDLAELHSFRLVYFKHKEIFLAVCIVLDEGSVYNFARLPV